MKYNTVIKKINRVYSCKIWKCIDCNIDFMHYENFQLHKEIHHSLKTNLFNCC